MIAVCYGENKDSLSQVVGRCGEMQGHIHKGGGVEGSNPPLNF